MGPDQDDRVPGGGPAPRFDAARGAGPVLPLVLGQTRSQPRDPVKRATGRAFSAPGGSAAHVRSAAPSHVVPSLAALPRARLHLRRRRLWNARLPAAGIVPAA